MNVIGSVIPAEPTKLTLGKIKSRDIKKRLEAAYDSWRQTGSLGVAMFPAVRDYAYNSLYVLEVDEGFRNFGSAETCDDWSQDISLKVWQNLQAGKFKGDTFASFHKWIWTICKNHRTDAFNDLREERDTTVGVTIVIEDKDGNEGEVQNPEVYESPLLPYRSFFTIPRSIQGVDLNICKLILAGMNHAQIAKELQMTESNVSKRVSRFRMQEAKNKAERREASRAKRQAGELEQKTSLAKGLAALRRQKQEKGQVR
jgi:RNA polymerase sigma factor (sigma-70 family)